MVRWGVRAGICVVVLAVLLGVALAAEVTKPAAAPPKGEVLSYCDQEGTKATYDFTATGNAKLILNDGKLDKGTYGMKMRTTAEYFGLSPEDGTIHVQGTVVSGAANFKAKLAKGSEQFEPAVMTYDIRPNGEIKYAELASGQTPMIPELFIGYGPGDLILVEGAGIFPKAPVSVGSTWKGVATIPVATAGEGNMPVQMKYDSKIMGREAYAGRNCYKIKTNYRVVSSQSIEEPETGSSANVKVNGVGAATWLFDPAAKLVMRMNASDSVSLTVLVNTAMYGEGENEAKITASTQASGKLVELNGEPVAAK